MWNCKSETAWFDNLGLLKTCVKMSWSRSGKKMMSLVTNWIQNSHDKIEALGHEKMGWSRSGQCTDIVY